MSDYSVTLSTTEPNNYVGLLKMRQGDINTQTIQATITANGQLFKFDHLAVFFNAVLPNGNVVRDKVTEVDYVNSKLNYIVADSFLQEVTQVTAWFSFENDEKIIDSTKNFQYSVIAGWKECITQGNYIYELSEIQREIEEIISNKDFTSLISKISSLETKIDYLENETTAQLADTEIIANNAAQKADAMASGSPKGVYATLALLQAAYPTGTTGAYLVTADGKWYYWSGSAWTVGGTYQSTGLSAKAVNFNKISAALQSTLTIPNTITQANFVLGKAIDGTGMEITTNAKFLLSGAITPYADKITLTNITNVATYLLYQLSYYNLAGTFISQSTWIVVSNNEILLDTSIDYTTVRIGLITSTTTSTEQMVYWVSGPYPNRTFTLNFKKLVANADNNNYGFVKPDGITTYIESGLLKAHPSGNAVNPDNLITVAKSNGMETVVQEAIRKCTNDDTIVIYPGTYDEQLNTSDNTYGNKSTFKSLVGVDREKCIITSHKDDYGIEALWVSKGYFKNLSVLADDTADVDPARNAYAMHADNNWLVNSKAIFENCYFYSKTTAAVGIGTRPGCDIIFRNCKFYTEHNLNVGGSHVGAVFFHNSNDGVNKGPNQRITFDNCEIISKYGSAMKVQRVGDDTNTVELTMKNCSLWSEETGLTNVITIDDTLYTGVSGNNINITGKTYGNNVDITTFIHA